MDPALWELLADTTAGTGDREVECIIRLDRPDADVAGVRLVARFGHVATCRIHPGDIVDVRRHPNVLSLKATRPLQLEPGPGSSAEVDVPPWAELPLQFVPGDERRPAGIGATGRGVMVGFVDTGLDVDHPSLKNPDGTTRILALWDQRDGDGVRPVPQPYGYGTVHDRRAIDAALGQDDPYAALDYHPGDADRGGGSHGLHVCDIAVGNGLGGGPVGVAPEADIAFVHLAQRGTGGLSNLGDAARLLEAIDWLFHLAGDRPCVVNCSLGRHGGPHDGRTLTEMALDDLLATTSNRCVVLSGGNYFAKPVHASDRLGPGDTTTLTVVVDDDDHTGNELEVWYDGADELAVQVESPAGETSPWVVLGEQHDIAGRAVTAGSELDEDGQAVGRLYHRAHDPNNGDNHVDLFLYPSASPGPWQVTLQARRIRADGVIHAWIERDQACEPCQARFPTAEADNRYTVGTIANGRLPLVVGAYDAHDPARVMAPFSSSGPTRDERRKPDLVAPGYQVLAARSAPAGSRRSPAEHVRKSGTSMAAPQMTGAVALCLASAPRPLTMREIRALVLGTTTPPHPNDPAGLRLGHGYLDIPRAVAAAASVLGSGPRAEARRPEPGRSAQPDLEELDMPCSCNDPTHDDDTVDTIDTSDELDTSDAFDELDSFDSGLDVEAELTPAEQSSWRGFVQALAVVGLRDSNDLTNMVFFARNPGRGGRKLSRDEPNFGPLSREWLKIRDTIVTPALGSATGTSAAPTAPAAGATPPAPPAGTAPLPIVATPLTWGSRPGRRYGVPETIAALDRIRQTWAQRHPGVQLVVTDISQLGGGRIPPHQSHRIGLDVDLHLRFGGNALDCQSSNYSQQRPVVQELVDLIHRNGVLPVKVIGFQGAGMTGVRPWSGHCRHLHVRFCMPAHHVAALGLNQVYAAGESLPSYTCRATGTADAESVAEIENLNDLDEEPYEEDELDEQDIDEAFSRGRITITGPLPGGPTRRPERVVFVPGLLGTSLIDGRLQPDEARRLCEKHLGWRDKVLRGSALYPCDKTPAALWGEIGALHWVYGPDEWGQRMRAGDGYTSPGGIRVGRLLDVQAGKLEYRPYAAFLDALRKEGFDVLEFPYDWRLSVTVNAQVLRMEIQKKWFGGVQEWPRDKVFEEGERITFVGHSLGGLVARSLIEGTLRGPELAKRLVTIGTPHIGAPVSYLYIAGRLHPFGDHSSSRQQQRAVQLHMAEVGPAPATAVPDPAADIHAQGVQQAVVNHMASTFELLPVYDFVETGKGKERWADSYQGHKHTGTGMPAVKVIEALRTAKLQPERTLGSWLAQHKIDYHFVATSGYSTVTGYHRGRNKVLVTKQGDGTVPLESAHPYPLAFATGRVTQKLLPKGRLGHSRLCERPDVLAYMLQVMGRSPARAASLQRDLSTEELVEAADKILAMTEQKRDPDRKRTYGIVLCVATVEARAGDTKMLVDPTTVETDTGGERLVKPPARLLSSDVFTVATSRQSLKYVLIQSQDTELPFGGMLFLPQLDERKVHFVTFNAGRLDDRARYRCRNPHHAEIHLREWLVAQDGTEFRNRLAYVDVVNRSRRPRNKGYSPCAACCDDLQDLPGKLGDPSRRTQFKADITWGQLYDGMKACGHPTSKDSLALMTKGGWTLHGDMPKT